MLRFQKIRRLGLILLTLMLLAIPATAQSSANGLTVDVNEDGVSVYRVNADGSQSLIIFVPSIVEPVVEASSAEPMSVSADVMTNGYLIVNTGALNVRTGPSARYTVITTIAGGTEVHVVGKNDGTEFWWFVELEDGTRGWINNIHTIIRGDLTGTPVVEAQGILIQPTLYIGYAGNLIYPSLPHQGHPVCSLPGRSEFPIIGRSQRTNWYQIVATCQDGTAVTGWVEGIIGAVRNPAGLEFPITDSN